MVSGMAPPAVCPALQAAGCCPAENVVLNPQRLATTERDGTLQSVHVSVMGR